MANLNSCICKVNLNNALYGDVAIWFSSSFTKRLIGGIQTQTEVQQKQQLKHKKWCKRMFLKRLKRKRALSATLEEVKPQDGFEQLSEMLTSCV